MGGNAFFGANQVRSSSKRKTVYHTLWMLGSLEHQQVA